MAKDKLVNALVLTDCAYGKCLDVITLNPEEAQSGVDAGVLDTNPAAVAVGNWPEPTTAAIEAA